MQTTFITSSYSFQLLINSNCSKVGGTTVLGSTYLCLTCLFYSNAESSLGSLGSSEQLPDSDSELDERSQRTVNCHFLVKQESEVSMDEDLLSYRDSLDLSSHEAHTDPEQDTEQDRVNPEVGEPPALPDNGPPDDCTGAEQELSVSLAELNVNQSNNNNYPCSPSFSLAGVPLARLSGKKLPLTKNRDSEPEFV